MPGSRHAGCRVTMASHSYTRSTRRFTLGLSDSNVEQEVG